MDITNFLQICGLILQTAILTVVIRSTKRQDIIIMNIADAFQVFADADVKLDTISADLVEGFAEITALIGQLQNTELTPEQEAIVNATKDKVDAIAPQAKQIADIVPNPPTP